MADTDGTIAELPKSQRKAQNVLRYLTAHLESREGCDDLEWAVGAERLRRRATAELEQIESNHKKGRLTLQAEDAVLKRQCLETVARLDVHINAVLVDALSLPGLKDYLRETRAVSNKVRESILSGTAVKAGTSESAGVLRCLELWEQGIDSAAWRKEEPPRAPKEKPARQARAEQQGTAAKKGPVGRPPQKPGPDAPIYWEEPDPMPRPQSRLEVHRERLKTLAARVAEQEYRDTFGRGPQPRSQFRRFRN